VGAIACVVLVVAGCGDAPRPLDAGGKRLPALRKRCGSGEVGAKVDAKIGWFRASDGVLLDGAALGDGDTGVVLAHESPADFCGWMPYAQVLSRAGLRVLLFDHRHFGLSESPIRGTKAGRFGRDLEGAVDELEREGAKKVFLMGASFGGVTSMVAGSRLGSKIAGVVSVSGETELANQYGGPQSELDALAAVPKLRVPFLIVDARKTRTSLYRRRGSWNAKQERHTRSSRSSRAGTTAGICSPSLPTAREPAGS